MTTRNPITFGVELEFLVPFLLDHQDDPAAGTDETRPITRVSGTGLAFTAVQVAIYDLLHKHNVPVQGSPRASFSEPSDQEGGGGKKSDADVHYPHLPAHWSMDGDISVEERRKAFGYEWVAVELRSPVLTSTSQDHKQVAQVVTLLRNHLRLRVNQTTGFHVHVGMGASALPPRVVHRLAQLLWCADGLLSGLHPPERAERGLGSHAPSVRHESHLAVGATKSWRQAAQSLEASTAAHRKPPPRNTRRASFDESSAIRRLLFDVEKLTHLRSYVARRDRKRAREDQKRFERFQEHELRCSTADRYHQVPKYQQELFGDWAFPGLPAQKEVAWIMDTETMVTNIWAELMHLTLPESQKVRLHVPSEYDIVPKKVDCEQEPVKDQGESPTEIVSGHDGHSLVSTRRNPFQDPGARARYLTTNGIEMPRLTDQEWLAIDEDETKFPTPLVQGLLFLTDPDLHDDTRRPAHLLCSHAYQRCNYNLNPYGFPYWHFRQAVMTIEFREATGSLEPAWVTAWASICAGLAEFCLAADEDQFLGVLMRLVEAETNEGLVRQGLGQGDASLLGGYDVLCFLSDLALQREAAYVKAHLGRGDKDAFWFPCSLVCLNQVGFQSPKVVGEGPGVLPPEPQEPDKEEHVSAVAMAAFLGCRIPK